MFVVLLSGLFVVWAFRVFFFSLFERVRVFCFCCVGGGRVLFFAVWAGACSFFLLCERGACSFFCCLGGCVFFFCCLGGGVFFLLLFGRVRVFFLLFGRGTGVHSLTRLPGSSLSDPTQKRSNSKKKNTGSGLGFMVWVLGFGISGLGFGV